MPPTLPVRLQTLLPLIADIQADPGRDIRLTQLAQELEMSPHHLQRVFKALVGASPKRLAARIALERAAAALVSTDDAVLTIAMDAGYESHEGFSRAFRRHFGVSPASYRRRGLGDATDEEIGRHTAIAHGGAPCLGLHRASLGSAPRTTPMDYSIERKEMPETVFLYVERRVVQTDIASALGQMLPAAFQYATRRGYAFAGPPTCRYSNFSPGQVTLAAGLPVAGEATGEGDVQVGVLPGGPAATTVHVGPYEGLHLAHAAVESWVLEQGATAGDPWEVYLTDPGEVPDPAQWQTLVVWPLSK